MRYHVRHLTSYRYAEEVAHSQHELHLQPRDMPYQRCLSSTLEITPVPNVISERLDYFGNRTCYVALATAHTELTVGAHSLVEVTAPPPIAAPDLAWELTIAAIAREPDPPAVQELTLPSPYAAPWAELGRYARASFPAGQSLLEGCLDLMARLHADFAYDPLATTIATPLGEVFERRRGVCQDFAHLLIACLRSLGLAARYVSGYLVTSPPTGQPRLQGADASHAWISVYIPGHGFVDLDPTNNLSVGDRHITLAVGRDFGDVTPLRGVVLGGGRHELSVAVDVVPEA